jgi:hypothetical protein
MDRVIGTITSALNTPNPQYRLIGYALQHLTKLESEPSRSEKAAYRWCAVIWENRKSCEEWEDLLFLSLKVGFRHHDPQKFRPEVDLTHTQHHQEFADAVFKSGRSEAIEDLLCALVVYDNSEPAVKSFSIYKQHIADLHNRVTLPFSLRLRRLVIHSIELIGPRGFEEGMAGSFVGLLNHLHISVEDAGWWYDWTSILVEIIQSAEGVRHLAVHVWDFLTEHTTMYPGSFGGGITYDPHVTDFLLDAQEWEKLECWLGVVWIVWLPEAGDVTEDVESATNLLFRRKPDAVRKLTQWMEQWSRPWGKAIPVSFQAICEQAQLDAGQVYFCIHMVFSEFKLCSRLRPPPDGGTEPLPHTRSPPHLDDRYWELLPLI